MERRHSIKSVAGVFFLVLAMPLLFWQCDRHETIVGNYHSVDTVGPGRISATLELQANGRGLWSIETDNAPFRWDLQGNRIRLHTQAGGVIEGTIDSETIQMVIPEMGLIVFRRDRQ
jgi:hypothetical protein